MNEKLNMLLKAFNSLDLSLEESKVLKKDIAMELILSSFIYLETQVDGDIGQLTNPENGTIIIFSSNTLANNYLRDNHYSYEQDLDKVAINMESFMIKSEKGEDISVDLNPGSDCFYHLETEEFIYLDEIYESEEFRDYWKSDSSRYLKDLLKNCKNQSFIDCYDSRLKSLDEDIFGKIEDADSIGVKRDIVENALIKTTENYREYAKIFDDDELLEEMSKLKIFTPILSDNVTTADEHNGVIDCCESEEIFNMALMKVGHFGYMLGFTDIEKLTNLDDVFIPNFDSKNKNYYVGVRSFLSVICFIAQNPTTKGLILNLEDDNYMIIEMETFFKHFKKLVRHRDAKLLNASDLALNHLYL